MTSSEFPFVPLAYERPEAADQVAAARSFYESIARRRTVREFKPDPIPEGVLEDCIATAGTAPS